MTERIHVFAEMGGKTDPVGSLFVSTGRRLTSTFGYAEQFLVDSSAYPIDPALPLRTQVSHVDGLPGAIADAAPDRWGRTLITRNLRHSDGWTGRSLGELDYLLGVSDDTRQGALRFALQPEGPFLAQHAAVPPLISLPRLLHAAQMVDQDDDAITAVKMLLEAGSGSLGGARPKASVQDDGVLHIAKFPKTDDEWDVMAWEATALAMAGRAGINVPQFRLVKVAGRSVLLVRRFDRHEGHRLGYLSAMSLISARDGEAHDYLEIADGITAHGDQPAADLRQLWRRIIFNVLINNTDDHLRNHGFLRARLGWRLAPAFDLNPNPTAQARQTSILGETERAGCLLAALECAADFGIDDSQAQREMAEITQVVTGWRSVARSHGINPAQIDRLAGAFETASQAL